MIVLESEVVRLSLSLSLPPGIWNATRKLVGTREGGRREERRWWTEGRRRNRTRERREGCTVAPVHAPGAFHNPEYCSRIHIYATSPGDNSAIMRRGRARVQLELPSSRHQPPFFPTNSPPCDFHMPSPPSPIFLCPDALEIVPNLGPRASSSFPRDLFNDATGKIRGNVSGPVQTANRIDYPEFSSRRNFCLHDTLFALGVGEIY